MQRTDNQPAERREEREREREREGVRGEEEAKRY